MLDLFNIAKPQGCDIQTFYGDGSYKSWNKPRGVSNIYMLLIGAGGDGNGTSGGGSGAVTVWYGSSLNVPDQLNIHTTTSARVRGVGNIIILQANSGSGSNAGAATTAGVFAASGFYQSIAGQAGSSGSQTASATTFLSGGAPSAVTSNYGYTTSNDGYFQTQPLIIGVGGVGAWTGGIGCGGGSNATTGKGGPGFVLIASW